MRSAHNNARGLFEKPTVNVHDPEEVRLWTSKLDISADDLVSAVEHVGNSSQAVLAYLLPQLLKNIHR